ncbi:MAG TPA: RNA polymerase sigma factor [Blastocatellia bacterium]|nr:RNA polymerase sigma factor [Blastocatellia bacterium]
MRESLATNNDEALLRLMMGGDAEALAELYDRRHPGVYRFALRMSGSHAVAEDVTQDVFMALIRDGNAYDSSRGSVAAYLYGMARNRVLKRLARDRSFVSLSDEATDEAVGGDERFLLNGDPLAELARSETIEAVRQAILALPAHYREVVVLCNMQEMNYEQAAAIIGCPVGTVRSRLHRARAMLINKLRAAGEAGGTGRVSVTRCAL